MSVSRRTATPAGPVSATCWRAKWSSNWTVTRRGVVKAGEAFWEPGGDVVHYQDGNNRTDIPLRYLVTMMMTPGQPMLVFVDDDELKQRGWVRRSPA